MLRLCIVYLVASVAAFAAPLLLLHLARSAPAGSNPAIPAAAIVCALGLASGLLAAVAPRHRIYIALVASTPTALLGIAMYSALAQAGGNYGVWLLVGLGGLAASLLAAELAGRAATRFGSPGKN